MLYLVAIYECYIKPFAADIQHTEKVGGWFAQAEAENSSGRVTF